ncbi:SDR family NAD(P)-dependent oxidoreductase [Actinoplanes missouriensis]|uniref:SDR family NAD(P)-dependent oxidoreductase n=1 Tax=Actinoplanes missouriensis TaxID=1866 RepID=UPI0033E10D25
MLSPGARVEAEITLDPADFVVDQHRLRDVCLLPGSAFFDVVWRLLRAHRLDPHRAVLTDVRFLQPVTTAPGAGRDVRVVVEAGADGRVRVSATSSPAAGSPAAGSDLVEHLRADLSWTDTPLPALAAEVRDAAGAEIDMATVYGRARAQDVTHGPRMTCTGTVRRGAAGQLARIDLAVPDDTGYFLHPARLDAATLLGFCQVPPPPDPFVPMFVSRFRAVRPLTGAALVHVPAPERLTDSGELFRNDILVYTLDGEPIAEITGFTSKRLRPGVEVTAPAAPAADSTPAMTAASDGPAVAQAGPDTAAVTAAVTDRVRVAVAERLGRSAGEIRTDVGFYELGLNSVDVVQVTERLEEITGTSLYPTLLFEHTTVDAVAAHLAAEHGPSLAATAPHLEPPAASPEPLVPQSEPRGVPSPPPEPSTTPATPAGRIGAWTPEWIPAPLTPGADHRGDIVVLGAGLAERLRATGTTCRIVPVVDAGAVPDGGYRVDAYDRPALAALIDRMVADGVDPEVFVDGAWPAPAPYPRIWALAGALIDSRRPGPHRIVVAHGPGAEPEYAALGALLRTISAETGTLRCRLAGTTDPAALLAEIAATDGTEPEVRYAGGAEAGVRHGGGSAFRHAGGGRLVRRHRPVTLPAPDAAPVRRGGAYVIAGAGRIGRHVGDWLAGTHGANLTLAGRGPESSDITELLDRWRRLGVTARYVRADLTREGDVARLIDVARREHGRIDGVLHCAGVVHDTVFFRKQPDESAAVLATKIDGVRLLDRATADDDLDFFVAFSSLAASLPSPGQCDYAYANAALAELMSRRTGPGVSLAVEWPFWADGGMTAPDGVVGQDRASYGLSPMPTAAGIEALAGALGAGTPHVLIGYGDPDRIGTALGIAPSPAAPSMTTPGAAASMTTPDAASKAAAAKATTFPAERPAEEDPIAIVGVAGRYPQAADLAEFWQRLVAGEDCVTEVPADRWNHDEIFDARPDTPGRTYGRWGGFLAGIDRFDRAFFGISRREAERMDPQERLFLTAAWQALEDAGHRPDKLADRRLGVFVGVMSSHFQLVSSPGEPLPLALHSSVANRVSYRMDLRGPSLAVDTACSSSLTAIHLAVRAIRAGECTWALAGGVNLMPHPEKYLQLAAGQWLSEDGRCRSFGAGGTGYVPGEGVGVVVLKPLSAARADGDHVHAVIRGSHLNHGGRASGFTVPNPGAQAEVVSGALERAGVDPASVTYIEAHGTGTSLGDPIEIQGLRDAYGGVPGPCAIGSVKSVIGHLESAAGVAAVTKVLLQMRHRTLVPTLHCDEPNPALRLADSPFRLQRTAEPWQPGPAGVRRAGISSFGAGGSNAHLILEEAPQEVRAAAPVGTTALVLSAEDDDQLARVARDMLAVLDGGGGGDVRAELARMLGVRADEVPTGIPLRDLGLAVVDLDLLAAGTGVPAAELARRTADDLTGSGTEAPFRDIAYTSQVGRTPRSRRLAVVCSDAGAARRALTAYLAGEAPPDGAYWGLGDADGALDLSGAARERDWERLARAWAAGAEVPWELCHEGTPVRRVPLPPYPFRGERCWPGGWKGTAETAAPAPARIEEPAGDRAACEVRRLPDGIMLITLGRPTFTDELLDGVRAALSGAAADDTVTSVVITGSGDVFSMGATPEAMERLAAKEGTFADVSFLHQLILDCDKPVISAMQGHASGGGLVFGLYADVVVMAREAAYGAPFLSYGFTPGAGSTFFLERKLGAAVAEQLFYTGRPMSGAELRERGASVDVKPRAEVLATALGHAQSVARQSRAAAAELKRELAGRTRSALSDVIPRELRMHERVLGDEAVDRVRERLHRDAPAAPAPVSSPTPAVAPVPAVTPAPVPSPVPSPVPEVAGPTGAELQPAVVEAVAAQLYLAPHEVNLKQTFSDMGLDSIGAVEVTEALSGRFGVDLGSVLVYDRPTVPELAEAVAEAVRHQNQITAAATAPLPQQAPPIVEPQPQPQPVSAPNRPELRAPAEVDRLPRETDALPSEADPLPAAAGPLTLRGARDPGQPPPATTPSAAAITLTGPATTPSAAAITLTDPAPERDDTDPAIAVIGMSGRFPHAPTLEDFWSDLAAGRVRTEEVPPDRWDVAAHYDPSGRPGTTLSKWASSLEGIDRFDARFFRMSPLEAEDMDPEQRLFLTEAWRALDDAGYAVGPDVPLGCGVFVGCTQSDYSKIRAAAGRTDTAHSFLGGAPSVLAARVSYYLNLTGPTAAVDSACSSSLLAVHLAVRSILAGDCDMAIAGGVALMLSPDIHVQTSAAGILSPTGRSAPFDAAADGIVLGEGVGAVVLKPLARALADGDQIHAVIRATGANGDGRSNGIAAPSGRAQTDLLRRVWRRAGITAGQIGLVEAHGTGTPLGDPIEVQALTEAFAGSGAAPSSCAIGSVKGNIGHTTMAAGIASLLKVLLALRHRQIPPTAGFTSANPRLDLDGSPFRVVRRVGDWPAGPDGQRVATVSSFGVSGTNCHLVVAGAPDRPRELERRSFVVPVSARTPEALSLHLGDLAEAAGSERELADVAYTLCAGRPHRAARAVAVAEDLDQLIAQLRALRAGAEPSLEHADPQARRIAEEFMAGGEPDLLGQFAGVPARRIGLPAHPLTETRHWPEPEPPAASPNGSAAGANGSVPAAAATPAASGEVTWWIAPDAWQVTDHRVDGVPVLPGTASLALMAATAGDRRPLEMTGVRWLRPVQVSTERRVRVGTAGDRRTLTCDGDESAIAVLRETDEQPARLDVTAIAARCPSEQDGAGLYQRFEAAGLRYGPAFRLVADVRSGAGEALGRLTAAPRREGAGNALVDVAALDAAIQVGAVLAGDGELLLPFAAARVVVRPAAGPPVWAYVRRGADGMTVVLAGADGAEQARIEGLSARSVARSVGGAPSRDAEPDVLVPRWTPAEGARPVTSGATLVVHSPDALSLARSITAGQDAELVPLDTAVDRCVRGDADAVHLVLSGGDSGEETLALVFDCLRALAKGPAARRPLAVTAVVDDLHPEHAGVAGMLRAASAENPHWQTRTLRLPAGTGAEAAAAAVSSAPAGHRVLAWRDGSWQRQVLTPAAPPAVPAATGPSPWRRNGVYLIAGGAGGIGYELSLHLARTSAADLVWLGRRPADERINARLAAVEAAGGRARYVRGDVAEPADVRAALAVAHTEFGPVTGAVHAAIDLRDRALAFAGPDDLAAALRPKSRGVRVWHQVLRDEPLDHFVLFSSAASFIDSPGQAAYAAASSVEDALADALRPAGRFPITVVNWGYWGSVGIVADPDRARAMAAAGVGSIEPAAGFAALERILRDGLPQAVVAVASADAWQRLGVTVMTTPTEERLDTLAGALLAARLDAVLPAPGDRTSRAALAAELAARPGSERLLDALVPILHRAGAVRPDGDDLIGVGRVTPPAPANPDAAEELLRRSVDNLPDVLAGRRNPLEVLFPGGSTELLERFYSGGPAERAVNADLAARVRAHVDAHGPGARVLEIGAGTGATTRVVLDALAGGAPAEYWFTDVSAAFLHQAEKTLRGVAPASVRMRYARFDAERGPAEQGLEPSYDVVVVAGVLHATADVRAAARNAAALLRPGGLLLVHETTRTSDFLTLTFGLTEGWWRFRDPELRLPHSPLLAPQTWTAVLADAGLSALEVRTDEGSGSCLVSGRRAAPDGSARDYVRSVFAEVLRHDPADLGDHVAFDEFGIDSLVSLKIIARFEEDLGALPATLLFEHLSIAELADHLSAAHADGIAAVTRPAPEPAAQPEPEPAVQPEPAAPTRAAAATISTPHAGDSASDDIAIIGVTGRYPGAPDLDAFWRLLVTGANGITEVPAGRFAWRPYYDPQPGTPNRMYTARAGFLDNVDRFDPAFFGILARDAITIDPQERLFLETCWDLLETTGNLGARANGRTGVFAGAMYGTYGQLGATAWPQGEMTGAHSAYWSIANRVSYLLDLSGPSYAVDSACSSSLTALHLACESLRRGECDTAIAGGVNVIIHPAHFVSLCSLTMLSPYGLCRVFDESADGFVPGEGVGAVLLKPLSRAVADGDDIWAVVKGSAVNAGGRTSGYTVPNPNAQAAVIAEALSRAGADPAGIGYLEAHGTGTALGDPIEVAGLRRVFDARPAESPLAVGSVKANVGHLEAAAGIAGLTRVLLQMRHGTIAPCANLYTVNPRIELGERLVLPREPMPWRDDTEPRRAGISSFGAGGANAHVVIEQYRPAPVAPRNPAGGEELFVLSARTPEQLADYAAEVGAALARPGAPALRDLAWTSQVGRPAFRHRLAVLATSTADLAAKLTAIAQDQTPSGVRRGAAPTERDPSTIPATWAEAAERWTDGERVDWRARWPEPPSVAAFPGHPQQRRRIWWEPAAAPVEAPPAAAEPAGPVVVAAPVSALGAATTDHHVAGRRVLPGAAMPELVHRALTAHRTDLSGPIRITDLVWHRPLDLDRSGDLRVTADGAAFTVGTPEGPAYASGRIEPAGRIPASAPPTAAAPGVPVTPEAVYDRLAAGGIVHGPRLRVLRTIEAAPHDCTADLSATDLSTTGGPRIDPALLDGAFQALAAFDATTGATTGYVPASIAELISVRPLPARCRVHARDVTPAGDTTGRTVDLDIHDRTGLVLAIRGLRLTALRTPAAASPAPAAGPANAQVAPIAGPAGGTGQPIAGPTGGDVRYRRPVWLPAGRPQPGRPLRSVLLHCPEPALRAAIENELDARDITRDGTAPDAILLVCPPGEADLDTQLRDGFDTTLRLAREHLISGNTGLRMLVAHRSDPDTGLARPAYGALGGLLRTLSLEHTAFTGANVCFDDVPGIAGLLVEELLGTAEGDVRHTAAGRQARTSEEYTPPAAQPSRPAGTRTYLVTGGAGALGGIITRHLAAHGPVNLVITGRRPADAVRLPDLTGTGAQVMYQRADLGDRRQVDDLITAVHARFGPLHGIVHAAGVTRDSRAVHKTAPEVAEVLAPKVRGITHLDAATRDEPLEFVVLFSSIVGGTGNLGQADYAFANAFLDAFAADRAARGRRGRTVAIGWPLWAESGMDLPAASRTLLTQHTGMVPLPTPDALHAFDRFRSGDETCPGVVAYAPRAAVAAPAEEVRSGSIEQELRGMAAGFLLVGDDEVDTGTDLMELGFDSISLTELITQVNARYGLDLLPTVLFETPTLKALAERLVHDHPRVAQAATVAAPAPAPAAEVRDTPPGPQPIAIIGMAGRFPGTEDLDAHWRAVAAGADRIGPVPADRADLLADPETTGIRGGFLPRVADFDAAAFGISPREARFMDPQQRHLLEVTWQALHDAGQRPTGLAGTSTGVYVGVATSDYNELMMAHGGTPEAHMATGVAHAVLANRVSHLLDLHGPSEAVDTACSSSLVAVHHAIRALQHGDCDLAIAGGVNLTLSPAVFTSFSRAGMLSPRGRCASFDDTADGYVRGEGVAAVVLKPLDRAVHDGDHVYAVLLGSAVNHSGRSPSLTAPNPHAQAQVVVDAMRTAGADPRTIGYLQAHGTGTSLGDPVEIEGLKQAYGRLYGERDLPVPEEPHVIVGSVKTTIGHLEAAAGIAGLVTTVLALRHGRIPPHPHLRQLNRYLRLDGTPLSIAAEAAEMPAVTLADGRPVRRAGVSSFGFGGANAHVVLEADAAAAVPPVVAAGPFVVPLSARTEQLLAGYRNRLADAIEADPSLSLDRIAYTLQTGRDALRHRFAVVATSRDELVTALRAGAGAVPDGSADPVAVWLAGGDVDWAALWPARPQRAPLPGPGFDRETFWFPVRPKAVPPTAASPAAEAPAPAATTTTTEAAVMPEPVAAAATATAADHPKPRPKVRLKPTIRASVAAAMPAPSPAAAPVESEPVAVREPVPAVKPEPENPPATTPAEPRAGVTVPVEALRDRIAEALGLPSEDVGLDEPLTGLGLDSILRVELVRWLHDVHGVTVPTSELYEHDTIADLAAYLATAPEPSETLELSGTAAQPDPGPEPDTAPGKPMESPADTERPLTDVVRETIEAITGARLDPGTRFTDGGLASLDMLRVVRALESALGTLPKTLLFDHPDTLALTAHLVERCGPDAVATLAHRPEPAGDTTPHQPTPEVGADRATIVPRTELASDPALSELVDDLERRYGQEAGLAGVSIAPLLFFPPSRDGYLAIGRRGDSVLVWRYTGPPDRFTAVAGALLDHCARHGLRLNLLSTEPLTELAGTPMLATAFGAVQRLENLGGFTLEGGKRGKLRYLVRKFGKEGDNRVVEYASGTDPSVDAAVAELVDRWAATKQMVNAYVAGVREQVRAGRLDPRHRMFLTYRDDELLAAIVLTRLPAEDGYLLDVEFYAGTMPLGGLEYSLVEIIGRLAAEGSAVLSFGGSFGVRVTSTSNPAADVELALSELRSVGIFDEGNYRFKKKFAPVEVPLFLCQPATGRTDATDVIMLIANPAASSAPTPVPERGSAPPEAQPAPEVAPDEDRLAAHGHNPVLLDHADVEFDLLTDSWFERSDAFVTDRMTALAAAVADTGPDTGTPAWMPLPHLSFTSSGRAAELRLCRSWPGRRGVVLHNDVFPTWQFALAETGLRAVRLDGGDPLAGLAAALDEHGDAVSFVCVELNTNAAGGTPIDLSALRAAARLLQERKVALVLDATRIVDNALAIGAEDPWRAVRELLDTADAVTFSLSKNFTVAFGGLVATRRPDLAARLAEDEQTYGRQLSRQQQALVSAALRDTATVADLVAERNRQVRALHDRLVKAGAPVHGGGTHCVLLDPRRDPAFAELTHPGPAMLAWLYRATGVRGGPHLGDGDLLRLTLPVGLPEAGAAELTERLAACFADRAGVRDLMPVEPATTAMALARARFAPVDAVPGDVREALAEGYDAAGDNLAVLTAHAPGTRRHLIRLDGATVEAFVHGSGPTLVLMHPFNIGAGMFARQFAGLGEDHRLVVLHHPGVGATRSDGTPSLEHITDLFAAALDRLGVTGRVHLAGASWGALLAQTFALRNPDRAASLTTICGSYRYANRVGEVNRLELIVAEDMAAVAATGVGDLAEPAGELLRCESMDPYVGLSYLDLFAGEPDLLRRLPRLSLPAMVIQGRLDTVVPVETARRLAAAIPEAGYTELPDAGHFPCVTHPGRINALLRAVIASAGDDPEESR